MKTIMTGCLALGLLCSVGVGLAIATDSDTATREITTAYQDVLGRAPDPAGLSDYRSKIVDQKWTEKQVRSALKNSAEYREGVAGRIVTGAYQGLLGRAPDAEGLKLYVDKIANEGWTEKQVRSALRQNPEYKSKNKK